MPCTEQERAQFSEQIESVCDNLMYWQPIQRKPFVRLLKKILWLFHGFPIAVRSDWDPAGVKKVQEALGDGPDVIVFDFPHSAVLAPESIPVPSVIFTHNVEAEIFKRHWQVARFLPFKLIWRNQLRKMQKFEKRALANFDRVVAVSERDCRHFRDEYLTRHCSVIPTGVDAEYFSYKPVGDQRQVVFCGSMDWMANIDGIEWFYSEIWPLVRESAPDATMKVVGRAPPHGMVNRICSAAPEWQFTDFVDDVREHIWGARAFVIPLRVGGGTRIKAFEAMAMGAPVVSTSIGIEGLPVTDERHYFCADDPASFANKVLRLLDDSSIGQRISESARQLVDDRYGYERAATVFENICIKAINRLH
jgi:glycosyltransferase involved in cell wall biosynthesis